MDKVGWPIEFVNGQIKMVNERTPPLAEGVWRNLRTGRMEQVMRGNVLERLVPLDVLLITDDSPVADVIDVFTNYGKFRHVPRLTHGEPVVELSPTYGPITEEAAARGLHRAVAARLFGEGTSGEVWRLLTVDPAWASLGVQYATEMEATSSWYDGGGALRSSDIGNAIISAIPPLNAALKQKDDQWFCSEFTLAWLRKISMAIAPIDPQTKAQRVHPRWLGAGFRAAPLWYMAGAWGRLASQAS